MTYELPDLSYDYAALEPAILGKALELHHSKHHAAYVAGANATLEALAAAREKGEYGTINQLEKNLAFHVSGHVLHSLFWKNMSPEGGGRPEGELGAAIDEFFGSFDGFRAQLEKASMGIQGSGWGALAWEPCGGRLVVEQVHDHQSNLGNGSIPLLVLDMWEHAFYLTFQNRKNEWVDAYWNVVDWNDVARRMAEARKLDLCLA